MVKEERQNEEERREKQMTPKMTESGKEAIRLWETRLKTLLVLDANRVPASFDTTENFAARSRAIKDLDRLDVEARALLSPAFINFKFARTSCSQCGADFGPGDHGFSHCENHRHIAPIEQYRR